MVTVSIALQQAAPPTIYADLLQQSFIGSQLAIRTRIDPGGIASQVRQTEDAVLKTVPIIRIITMNEQIDSSIVPQRLIAMLSAGFGGLGALLAVIGLYGLLAYTVARRTHEIGVRMALGAAGTDVMRTVLRDALWMVCAGLAIGAPLAFWGKRVAASLIPDLPVASPLAIVVGAAIMIAVGLIAAYLPARRAMRVDPMVALVTNRIWLLVVDRGTYVSETQSPAPGECPINAVERAPSGHLDCLLHPLSCQRRQTRMGTPSRNTAFRAFCAVRNY